jgi:2-polyprenyl-3-methyl-5-hydroxy-6-metoxy-1,4-benzoquinol methylase
MARFLSRLSQHAMDLNRWRYFGRCLMGYPAKSRWRCPNCGGERSSAQERKHFVTKLLRCNECKLLFRAPTDPPDFGKSFYQSAYQQGFTTDCPSDERLSQMLQTSFHGTPKDFQEKVDLLKRLGLKEQSRVLDYGASWGYGTWQFGKAGFEAIGYEPSQPRARYAREKLAVNVLFDESELDKLAQERPFDSVFSSHVLEHVPQPSQVIERSQAWLKPGGYLVAFTPNGSTPYRERDPQGYRNHWGMVHPNYLDADFYESTLGNWATYITGTPIDFNRLASWDQCSTVRDRLNSWELLVISKRPN